MGIATELREAADLRKRATKIAEETMEDGLIVSHRGKLQRQRKGLDVRFENLFETRSGLTQGIRGGVKGARFATARAYSRQMSWGASWT